MILNLGLSINAHWAPRFHRMIQKLIMSPQIGRQTVENGSNPFLHSIPIWTQSAFLHSSPIVSFDGISGSSVVGTAIISGVSLGLLEAGASAPVINDVERWSKRRGRIRDGGHFGRPVEDKRRKDWQRRRQRFSNRHRERPPPHLRPLRCSLCGRWLLSGGTFGLEKPVERDCGECRHRF